VTITGIDMDMAWPGLDPSPPSIIFMGMTKSLGVVGPPEEAMEMEEDEYPSSLSNVGDGERDRDDEGDRLCKEAARMYLLMSVPIGTVTVIGVYSEFGVVKDIMG